MENKYSKIVATLRNEILRGKYDACLSFPSVAMIIRRFGVSNLTAVKVLGKLKEEGLVYSRQGRGTFVTRKGASRKIGVIMPGLATSEFFHPLAATFIRLAQEFDYDLQFAGAYPTTSSERIQKTKDLAADFARRRLAGVIFQPLEYAADRGMTNRRILALFDKVRIPVVLLDSEVSLPSERNAHDLVSIDNVLAGRMVGEHLIGRGARNVHFLMRTNWYPNIVSRLDGVVAALMEHDIGWSRQRLLVAEPDDVAAVRRHLRRRPRPDAFVCECDPTAAAFLKTLDLLGVRVPQDMMVASFDDVNIARLTQPSLTSIRQPYDQLAESAFLRLLERMARPDTPPVSIFHPVTLTVRKSTERSK